MPDNLMSQVQDEIESQPSANLPFLERLKEFAELSARLRDVSDEHEMLKKRLASLQPGLIEDMAIAGMESARVGALTVYIRTDWYVTKKGGIETQTVCNALRQIGRGDMVEDGYSSASLKALVLEWTKEGQEVPALLNDLLNIGSNQSLVARKA